MLLEIARAMTQLCPSVTCARRAPCPMTYPHLRSTIRRLYHPYTVGYTICRTLEREHPTSLTSFCPPVVVWMLLLGQAQIISRFIPFACLSPRPSGGRELDPNQVEDYVACGVTGAFHGTLSTLASG